MSEFPSAAYAKRERAVHPYNSRASKAVATCAFKARTRVAPVKIQCFAGGLNTWALIQVRKNKVQKLNKDLVYLLRVKRFVAVFGITINASKLKRSKNHEYSRDNLGPDKLG